MKSEPWRSLLVCCSAALLWQSCAAAAPYVPIIEQALQLAAAAASSHGADLSKAPITCEHEYDPKTKKLLFLCEADLSKAQ